MMDDMDEIKILTPATVPRRKSVYNLRPSEVMKMRLSPTSMKKICQSCTPTQRRSTRMRNRALTMTSLNLTTSTTTTDFMETQVKPVSVTKNLFGQLQDNEENESKKKIKFNIPEASEMATQVINMDTLVDVSEMNTQVLSFDQDTQILEMNTQVLDMDTQVLEMNTQMLEMDTQPIPWSSNISPSKSLAFSNVEQVSPYTTLLNTSEKSPEDTTVIQVDLSTITQSSVASTITGPTNVDSRKPRGRPTKKASLQPPKSKVTISKTPSRIPTKMPRKTLALPPKNISKPPTTRRTLGAVSNRKVSMAVPVKNPTTSVKRSISVRRSTNRSTARQPLTELKGYMRPTLSSQLKVIKKDTLKPETTTSLPKTPKNVKSRPVVQRSSCKSKYFGKTARCKK